MTEINCIIVDDEPMAREIIASYISQIPSLKLIKSCKNVNEAIEITSKSTIDLIFLDINMPGISGMSFAKIIDKRIKVIFTTASREFAVEGFNIEAVDYLLKPISLERFQQAISKYASVSITLSVQKDIPIKKDKNNFIFVRSDRKMVKINFDDIIYIESLSDYIKIILTNKTIVTRETISSMESKLALNNFIRIHRSFIIAINKIDSFTNEFVEINKKALPISRTYKDLVIKRLNPSKQ